MHIDLHNKSPSETAGIPLTGDANTTEVHNHNLMHGAPSKELGCGITGKAEGKTANSGSFADVAGGGKSNKTNSKGKGKNKNNNAGAMNDLSVKESLGSSHTHTTGSTGVSHTHTAGSTGASHTSTTGSAGSHSHTTGSSAGISAGGMAKNIATDETTLGGCVASGTYNANHKEPCAETSKNVSSFLRGDGQTNTTVHETVKPAVVKEHVTTIQHDENQRVIDREIHQDHHHTTVQPIRDESQLPSTHAHAVANKETREFRHGNDQRIHQALETEQAQFRDTTDVGAQLHTSSMSKTVAGEHVHHHVHENIQPVIERNVHQAHVLHTTHPVHEIHHNESMHHTASVLPEISLSDFQAQGGSFNGEACRSDAFKGAPKSVDERMNATHTTTLGGEGAKGTTTVTGNWGSSTDKSSSASIHTRRDSGQCSCVDTTACNGMCGRANSKVHHRANGIACDKSEMNSSSCGGTMMSCGGAESTTSKSSTKGKKKN